MSKPLKVQVEPLSQQRWTKIERSLFARLEAGGTPALPGADSGRRRPRLAWLAAAAALGVMLLVLAGSTVWNSRDHAEQTSRITTGASASHLALPGLSLDVQPESAVVVSGKPEQAMLIVVDRGTVLCDVSPRPSAAPLIVQAGAARVRVVGTRFSVHRLGESARVAVEHGQVEVSMAGHTWRVGAGQIWPAALSAATGQSATAPGAGATLPASPAAPVAEAETPSNKLAAQRTRATPAASEGESATQPPGPSSQAQFEEATRLERSDPARALALYRAVEAGSESWAPPALFARGRLEAARGNKAEARRLLEQYLARFPRETNAPDARAVLARLR